MSKTSRKPRPWLRLALILLLLIAITYPFWGFASLFLKPGDQGAAAILAGTVLAMLIVPMVVVALATWLANIFVRRTKFALHPIGVAGIGAVVGSIYMVLFTGNVPAGLISGAIPGALVALASAPFGRRPQETRDAGR
jgi:membrane protease YdiL (CAAX protease family)